MSKFDRAGLLIFGLVFASRDFEVGMVRSLRRVDHQPRTGLIYFWIYYFCTVIVKCYS